MFKRLIPVILSTVFVSAMAFAQNVQVDAYLGGGQLQAGGAFGYKIYNLGPDLGTAEVPLYARVGAAMGADQSRFTLGVDAQSPEVVGLLRFDAGAGVEFTTHNSGFAPYLRLGTQIWVFFGDLDFSTQATTYRAGLRLNF